MLVAGAWKLVMQRSVWPCSKRIQHDFTRVLTMRQAHTCVSHKSPAKVLEATWHPHPDEDRKSSLSHSKFWPTRAASDACLTIQFINHEGEWKGDVAGCCITIRRNNVFERNFWSVNLRFCIENQQISVPGLHPLKRKARRSWLPLCNFSSKFPHTRKLWDRLQRVRSRTRRCMVRRWPELLCHNLQLDGKIEIIYYIIVALIVSLTDQWWIFFDSTLCYVMLCYVMVLHVCLPLFL